MPLYEYRCRKCSRRFETLVFGDEKPACPKCQGRDLEKLWSAFAVAGSDRKSDDFGGGDFGGGDDFGGDLGGGGDPGDDFGGGLDASGGCGRCGDPRGPGSCAVN
ncbi:MAG TPA: zinc ribbon domain-containing protein [Verrucomicrobiae bacterium]|nr:zinc ribbon domain-containing protein [Verrucomicrobiae bacterium]